MDNENLWSLVVLAFAASVLFTLIGSLVNFYLYYLAALVFLVGLALVEMLRSRTIITKQDELEKEAAGCSCPSCAALDEEVAFMQKEGGKGTGGDGPGGV